MWCAALPVALISKYIPVFGIETKGIPIRISIGPGTGYAVIKEWGELKRSVKVCRINYFCWYFIGCTINYSAGWLDWDINFLKVRHHVKIENTLNRVFFWHGDPN